MDRYVSLNLMRKDVGNDHLTSKGGKGRGYVFLSKNNILILDLMKKKILWSTRRQQKCNLNPDLLIAYSVKF